MWNIMFQGADALTVGERNADGLAQKLRDAAAAGRVAVGHHPSSLPLLEALDCLPFSWAASARSLKPATLPIVP